MPPSNSRVPQLLSLNAEFAKAYTRPFSMAQLRASITDPVLVLTCMDPRVIPEQFLGPKNPKVAVFRNAGGRVTPDVIRTAAVLRSLASYKGVLAVMVIHHTDCGMTHLTDGQIRDDIRQIGADESSLKMEFGCFAAEMMEEIIKKDVQELKDHEILQGVEVTGYVLETESGLLRQVKSPT